MMSVLWWPVMAGFGALACLIWLVVFAFWIWMIVDSVQRHFKNNSERIVWIIIVILAGWLGALIYFFIIRNANPKGLMKK